MRISLAPVVVAITAQNKRSAHARRILTIPSINCRTVGPGADGAKRSRSAPIPRTSLTPDLLSGTCAPAGRLPRCFLTRDTADTLSTHCRPPQAQAPALQTRRGGRDSAAAEQPKLG